MSIELIIFQLKAIYKSKSFQLKKSVGMTKFLSEIFRCFLFMFGLVIMFCHAKSEVNLTELHSFEFEQLKNDLFGIDVVGDETISSNDLECLNEIMKIGLALQNMEPWAIRCIDITFF